MAVVITNSVVIMRQMVFVLMVAQALIILAFVIPVVIIQDPIKYASSRVLPEELNLSSNTKIRQQIAYLAKTGYVVLKVALLLWYNQVIFSKISCFLQWFFIFKFFKLKSYLFQNPLPGLETEFVTYFKVLLTIISLPRWQLIF